MLFNVSCLLGDILKMWVEPGLFSVALACFDIQIIVDLSSGTKTNQYTWCCLRYICLVRHQKRFFKPKHIFFFVYIHYSPVNTTYQVCDVFYKTCVYIYIIFIFFIQHISYTFRYTPMITFVMQFLCFKQNLIEHSFRHFQQLAVKQTWLKYWLAKLDYQMIM